MRGRNCGQDLAIYYRRDGGLVLGNLGAAICFFTGSLLGSVISFLFYKVGARFFSFHGDFSTSFLAKGLGGQYGVDGTCTLATMLIAYGLYGGLDYGIAHH